MPAWRVLVNRTLSEHYFSPSNRTSEVGGRTVPITSASGTITTCGEQSTSTTRSSGTALFESKAADAGAMISVSKGHREG